MAIVDYAHIYSDTNWHVLGDSGEPTLQNSWVNYDTATYPPARFRKFNDIVYLEGLIKNGTATSGTVIFTLPVGYRTAFQQHFVVASGGVEGTLRVHPNGELQISGGISSSWADLGQVFYQAAQ